MLENRDLVAVNRLWQRVYPYTAAQAMAAYGRTEGAALELGVFAGGITFELAKENPGLSLTIAADSPDYLDYLKEELAARGLGGRVGLAEGPLESLPFPEQSFDLIILRGAFFFIMNRPAILDEIARLLRPGGLAFVGGGYGRGVPQEVIDEIADESRVLNDRLGRRRVTIDELRALLAASRSASVRAAVVSEEGGVWLLMREDFPVREETVSSLVEALALGQREVVSITGGGGKTSLMFGLAHELANAGQKVVTTTTTRIMPPRPHESICVIVEEDEENLLKKLSQSLGEQNHVTVARLRPDPGHLKGLLPATVDRIMALGLADYVINEADGSARKPLKAPNTTEPVIPVSTTLTVAVVGLEALGQPLTPEIAFRTELITKLTGLQPGDAVTPEAVARLATDAHGLAQYTPPAARIIPLLNKLDRSTPEEARSVAQAILRRRNPQIPRVLAGSVGRPGRPFHVFKPV
jgi:probable selenium-dependent hydroxylase accessory protein YqeC